MSRYRKISVRMWGDDKFRALSRPKPNGQTLWQYLLTGPHTTALPAAFSIGEASLCEALGWPLIAFRKVFQELLDKRMVYVDWKSRLVFIPNALKHNPPENPNVVVGWRTAFNELPDCQLKVDVFQAVKSFLEGLVAERGFNPNFVKAFGEAFTKVFTKTDTETVTGTETETEGEGERVLALGESGFARMTAEEREKLYVKLGESIAERFIHEFDNWVAQAPDAKKDGIRRRDRQAYPSIIAWSDRAKKEGNHGSGGKNGTGTQGEIRGGSSQRRDGAPGYRPKQ